MLILADTHVHIYPWHRTAVALRTAYRHLSAPGETCVRALFLTERHDCHFFREIQALCADLPDDLRLAQVDSAGVARFHHREDGDLYVVAGRQLVSAERIELLALTIDTDLEDGAPVRDLIAAVRGRGGIPVLSWAPGKWFGGRERIISGLIDESRPDELMVGDTSLRPTVWPEPILMRQARKKGLRVLAGSDPLPADGEESVIGSYAMALEGAFDPARPLDSFRALLWSGDARFAGCRGGPFEVFRRLYQHHRQKR